MDFRIGSDMREDILKSQFLQDQFTIIGVSAKVFHAVKTLAKTAQCFAKIFLPSTLIGAVGVDSAKMNTPREAIFDVSAWMRSVSYLILIQS
jgi:hypothetical protein